jgi:hypothetical protein
MRKPTIHLNGTSREALESALEDANVAIGYAIEALAKAAPNGRDYYPQGDNAFNQARNEHVARIAKLTDVLADIQALYEHVVTVGRDA